MSVYSKLASAVFNNLYDGLRGYHLTPAVSIELIEDAVINERLLIIKEYILKGLTPKKELMLSINCIPVDCLDIDRCRCPQEIKDTCLPCDACGLTEIAHFELPQIMLDFGTEAIEYIGSTDRQLPFIVYTSSQLLKYNRYRKRGRKRPFVFIDYTPNHRNMNDGFIFNAPLIKLISAVIIPKDPRQLENYGCCPTEDIENMTFINAEIEKRLTEKYLRYYRLLQVELIPNTLEPV